jgi:HD-GYP domain-containing protein (c-di-GMP phosphodiesterase class II)
VKPAAPPAKLLARLVPQPLTAMVMSGLALAVLLRDWSSPPAILTTGSGWTLGLLALGLAATVVVTGLYPIHILYRTKVLLTTVPLYLAATLLPPSLAALTAGLGILTLQLATHKKMGSLPSDIATAASRWVLVAYAGSWVAQWATGQQWPLALTLTGAALVMLAGDVVTAAFEIAPMADDSPWRVMVQLAREGSLIELALYLLGVLGAVAARQQTWSLLLLVLPTYVVYLAFKNTRETQAITHQLLESMADAVDLRDTYTGGHSNRVAELSQHTLHELNVTGPEADLIHIAARVHDIGKIGIPDAVLNKPGRLNADEWRVMQGHAERGAELIARYSDFARGVDIVRHHHERWDGSGYPGGLKGPDIPFGARVIAVVDSFDAMTSNRPYRGPLSTAQAIGILQDGRGTQWDPAVVDALLRYLEEHPAPAPEAAPVSA